MITAISIKIYVKKIIWSDKRNCLDSTLAEKSAESGNKMELRDSFYNNKNICGKTKQHLIFHLKINLGIYYHQKEAMKTLEVVNKQPHLMRKNTSEPKQKKDTSTKPSEVSLRHVQRLWMYCKFWKFWNIFSI